MSKIFLEKAIFVNRAPFEKREFSFKENELAILSSVNGKGKTTILSHITDAFYEMARNYYHGEFEGKENKYYRLSSGMYKLNAGAPSFVYFRFSTSIGEKIDYIDVRDICTEEQYNEAIEVENKIPFGEFSGHLNRAGNVKQVSRNFNEDKANETFKQNILTYFPSYRFEQPGYLTDSYKVKLHFRKESTPHGYLLNPIEVISSLNQLVNWILDIVLDMRVNQIVIGPRPETILFDNLNLLISNILSSKFSFPLRFGIGQRHYGGTRLQIMNTLSADNVYPTVFNLSSGEVALLTLFGEIARQGDRLQPENSFTELQGIVLIDEIDKHLHIKLQKEVLPTLLILFPNIQFVISSHSPFLSLGLAERAKERTKIVDLDTGLSIEPTDDPQYEEVYQMMIAENERFKHAYEAIRTQIDVNKELQLITEGKNTDHIKKAIEVLDPTLLPKINIVNGAEDKSGDKQLKNAFDIMSKASHASKFLYIWDCDSASVADSVVETENFFKFSFEKMEDHTKAKKGIENLYSDNLFTSDVYDQKETEIDYGGKKTELIFSKAKFLEKIKLENDVEIFKGFSPLLEKIRIILSPPTANLES